MFHCDNPRLHIARLIQEKIEELRWKLLKHPPNNPDLAQSDYHLLGSLRLHLGGMRFAADADVELKVHKWLSQQSTDILQKFNSNFMSSNPTILPYELIHSRNRGTVDHNVHLPAQGVASL
ncbi:hypothetical protein AVEN_142117-1 [Araneus ventricosus]|uniref:Histone-lysine N-methyltransferase SETMAR n=1 Tax=Araneus ventricosus TaxID=182803 RepID=A0A4Y2DHX7_ARAVE|nr:hypothetical protein AVEN_142117-1 [Araneus ventricosus]